MSDSQPICTEILATSQFLKNAKPNTGNIWVINSYGLTIAIIVKPEWQ